jgi:hypothetical protein
MKNHYATAIVIAGVVLAACGAAQAESRFAVACNGTVTNVVVYDGPPQTLENGCQLILDKNYVANPGGQWDGKVFTDPSLIPALLPPPPKAKRPAKK